MSNAVNKKLIASLKLILLLFIIVGIPAFLYFRYGSEVFSTDSAYKIIAFLKQNPSTAFLLIICIQIVQVVICFLPGQPIQFASSYMFGVVRGFLLSIIGAVIGTVISFYLAKLLGSDALNLFFDEEQIRDYRDKLNSGNGLLLALLLYLIPGFPKDIVSYAAGISEMRFRPFLLIATLGRSPGMLGSLLLGYFFERQNYTAMIIIGIICAVTAVVCIIKRGSLIRFLDRLEMKDIEREEKTNG